MFLVGYLPLTLIFLLSIHILLLVRKHRKVILTVATTNDCLTEESGNSMSFGRRFFAALKAAEDNCHCRRNIDVLYSLQRWLGGYYVIFVLTDVSIFGVLISLALFIRSSKATVTCVVN